MERELEELEVMGEAESVLVPQPTGGIRGHTFALLGKMISPISFQILCSNRNWYMRSYWWIRGVFDISYPCGLLATHNDTKWASKRGSRIASFIWNRDQRAREILLHGRSRLSCPMLLHLRYLSLQLHFHQTLLNHIALALHFIHNFRRCIHTRTRTDSITTTTKARMLGTMCKISPVDE